MFNTYTSFQHSTVAEPQREMKEQLLIADMTHRTCVFAHYPSTVAGSDERSSKHVRTANEAGVGAAMEAAISIGEEAGSEPLILPES